MSEDAPATEVATPPATTEAPEPRTYTQEDFDRVVGKVRSEERAKFADYDSIREKADRYDEAANAAKSLEEKLQEQLADRERELEQLRESQREASIRAAITAAASRKGVVDPDAAVKLIDAAAVEFDDVGQPHNADQLIDALVQEKQYLLGKPAPVSFDGGTRTPAPQTSDPKSALGTALLQHIESTKE